MNCSKCAVKCQLSCKILPTIFANPPLVNILNGDKESKDKRCVEAGITSFYHSTVETLQSSP